MHQDKEAPTLDQEPTAEGRRANERSMFENAQFYYDRIAEQLNLDEGTWQFLRTPVRELTVNFPVVMDDGSVRIFRGYRVIDTQEHEESARPDRPWPACPRWAVPSPWRAFESRTL